MATGTGTWTMVKIRRRTQDGNGDRDRDGSEDISGDGNGDQDNGNGNEDSIAEAGREAKICKRPQNSCRHHAGNGGDLGGKNKECRKGRVGPVAVNPVNPESSKEAGGGAQCTQSLSKNCQSRERVPFVASDQRFL